MAQITYNGFILEVPDDASDEEIGSWLDSGEADTLISEFKQPTTSHTNYVPEYAEYLSEALTNPISRTAKDIGYLADKAGEYLSPVADKINEWIGTPSVEPNTEEGWYNSPERYNQTYDIMEREVMDKARELYNKDESLTREEAINKARKEMTAQRELVTTLGLSAATLPLGSPAGYAGSMATGAAEDTLARGIVNFMEGRPVSQGAEEAAAYGAVGGAAGKAIGDWILSPAIKKVLTKEGKTSDEELIKLNEMGKKATNAKDDALSNIEELKAVAIKDLDELEAIRKRQDQDIEDVLTVRDGWIRSAKTEKDVFEAKDWADATIKNIKDRNATAEVDRMNKLLSDLKANHSELVNEKLADGVTIGDILSAKERASIFKGLNKEDGKVGVQSLAKTMNDKSIKKLLNDMSTPIEKVAKAVRETLGGSAAETLGLRSANLVKDRAKAVESSLAGLSKRIDGLEFSNAGPLGNSATEFKSLLQQYVTAIRKGDMFEGKKLSSSIDKRWDEMDRNPYFDIKEKSKLKGVVEELNVTRKTLESFDDGADEASNAIISNLVIPSAGAMLGLSSGGVGAVAGVIGGKLAQGVAKKQLSQYLTKAAAKRLDEVEKALGGELEYDEVAIEMAKRGESIGRIIGHLVDNSLSSAGE